MSKSLQKKQGHEHPRKILKKLSNENNLKDSPLSNRHSLELLFTRCLEHEDTGSFEKYKDMKTSK